MSISCRNAVWALIPLTIKILSILAAKLISSHTDDFSISPYAYLLHLHDDLIYSNSP